MRNIYEILIAVQIMSAVFTFFSLYFVTAGYGRHSSKNWGPSINPRLGWLLMESPVVFIPIYFAITGVITSVTGIMLAIWLTHYIQRTFIYPFLIRGEEKMPLLIVLFSLIFNSMNGFINGYYLFNIADYSLSWFADPRFIAGTLIFIAGMTINIHSDSVVRKLRKENGSGYFLPEIGLHKFVASPNYFGEILEWTGWAVLTWSIPGLAFMLFTMANLVPRANKHRNWYRKTFGDKYPVSRKRIFPFIY